MAQRLLDRYVDPMEALQEIEEWLEDVEMAMVCGVICRASGETNQGAQQSAHASGNNDEVWHELEADINEATCVLAAKWEAVEEKACMVVEA